MGKTIDPPDPRSDLGVVRAALRSELTSRGHDVASDTLNIRGTLYIVGANDLALALFEFHHDASDAATVMYQASGSWGPGMPPRFAVLPASESESSALEMLEQMRATPLFYEREDGTVSFQGLDAALRDHLDP